VPPARWTRLAVLTLLSFATVGFGSCSGTPGFRFLSPDLGLVSQAGQPLAFALELPRGPRVQNLRVRVDDGEPLDPALLQHEARLVRGELQDLEPGHHLLSAEATLRIFWLELPLRAFTWLELVALDRPDQCEILNNAECLAPFPSSRFLEEADTATRVRVAYPEGTLPGLPAPLSSEAYAGQDGFSPMTQVVAHFPGRVDLGRSRAAGLDFLSRTTDARSLERSSPTLLLDVDDGMRPVLHFAEIDAKAAIVERPDREAVILRPLESLVPGHRYIVAFRRLFHPDGTRVRAEPVFAALRDRRPSDIPAVEARRAPMEEVFRLLRGAGVARRSLVLAFDFVVQSDSQLTGEMLSMRDQAFARLDANGPVLEVFPFLSEPEPGADASVENDCGVEGERIWRQVNGRFEVPLFLSSDPLLAPLVGGRLVDDDGDGVPEAQGSMLANYSVAIPCSVLGRDGAPLPAVYVGHGLFSNGRSSVGIPAAFDEQSRGQGFDGFERIAGATDWLGLSSFDFDRDRPIPSFRPNDFGSLPDRIRQGMTNALVLMRLLKRGSFNAHPAFQKPDGVGLFAGPLEEVDFWGISLGGILGTQLAALSPDVARIAIDVPGANFSLLNARSAAFGQFALVLDFLNSDPLAQTLFFGLAEELWDSGEPGGYLRHVTAEPLPGSGEPKRVLMTVQRFDGIVPNLASELSARSMGLANLRDVVVGTGSASGPLVALEDRPGPLVEGEDAFRGAVVYYDAGMYDVTDPEIEPFVPPLSNRFTGSNCDPHGRGFDTPAKVVQATRWLRDGVIESFCDGFCDALASAGGFQPFELPEGRTTPCDPLTAEPPDFGR
jgi:hypothetical protein